MLVGADIDQLHATIAAFRRGSAELNDVFQRALQAMQAMQNSPWSGQHRQQAEAVWERIQVQFTPTLNALEDLTARTERFASNLIEAGRSFYDPAQIEQYKTPASHKPDTPDTIGNVLRSIDDFAEYPEKLKGFWEIFKGLGSITLVATGLSVVRGSTYPGQLIIKGRNEILELAFLDPHLRHLKGDTWNVFRKVTLNSTSNAVLEGLKEFKKALPVEFAFNVASSAHDNWEEYKGDPQHWQKTVAGTAIDATVKTVLSGVGIASGTAIGGAVGGALLGAISGGTLAPLGVAIGARVGGFVGGYVADKIVGDWIQDQSWYKSAKDEAVQWGADFIDQTAQTAQKTMETAVQYGQQILEQGQQVQRSVSDWVSNTLGSWFR